MNRVCTAGRVKCPQEGKKDFLNQEKILNTKVLEFILHMNAWSQRKVNVDFTHNRVCALKLTRGQVGQMYSWV